jgi:hypothetical protein
MIRNMLREVLCLIDLSRQRGQTTRLIEQSLRDGVLLVAGNAASKNHIERESLSPRFETVWLSGSSNAHGPSKVTVTSLMGLTNERGRDHKNGVVFDNHAVHTIAGMADQEILKLENRVSLVERQNAELRKQLEFAREHNDRLTAVIATQARRLTDSLPPPDPRDTGGNPPWGESYEAVQDLKESVRRAVEFMQGGKADV